MIGIPVKPGWSPAEKWAWRRIAGGKVADFSKMGRADPRVAAAWGADRTLRVGFLHTILFEKAWSDLIPVAGVRIVGARYCRTLNLAHGRIQRSLWLDRCRFERPVNLAALHVEGLLSMRRSFFVGRAAVPALTLTDAVAEHADLSGSIFEGTFAAAHVKSEGRLDLSDATLGGQLLLPNAILRSLSLRRAWCKDIDLSSAEIGKNLDLCGATVDGDLRMNDIRIGQHLLMAMSGAKPTVVRREVILESAVIEGNIDLDGARVDGPLNMNDLRVSKHVSMRAVAAGKPVFKEAVDLGHAVIGNHLMLSGAVFRKPVSLDGIRIGEDLRTINQGFGYTVFLGGADFIGAKVKGDVDMIGAAFGGKLNLESVDVGGSLLLRAPPAGRTNFRDVTIVAAKVEGVLSCEEAVFRHNLKIASVSFGQDMNLIGAKFTKEAMISNVRVGGSLKLVGAYARRALVMRDLRIGQSLCLGGVFRRPVDLSNAQVDQTLDLSAAQLRRLNLSGARVGGQLCLGRPPPNKTSREETAKWDRVTAETLQLDLRDATAGSLQDWAEEKAGEWESSWPREGFVELDGFTYNRLGGAGGDSDKPMIERSSKWYRSWLARDRPYSPQPYEYLAGILRQAGRSEKANQVLYAARERALASAWTSGSYFRWLGLGLLKVTIGYGIGSRFFFALAWVALFTCLGLAALIHWPSPGSERDLADTTQKFAYSLDQLLPIIELNHSYPDVKLSTPAEYYFYVHKLLGFLLGSFIVAGVAGLTQRSKS